MYDICCLAPLIFDHNRQRLFGELRDEVNRLEDRMFYMFMKLEQNDQTFNSSQNFLQITFLVKVVLNVLIAFTQSVLVVKLFAKYRGRFGAMI